MLYRSGTATFTNNSDLVDFAGANLVSAQIFPGYLIFTAAGAGLEIAEIVTPTRLRLVQPYVGQNAGSQAYFILPTNASLSDATEAMQELLVEFGTLADTVGQGMFGDGTAAAPGMRFASDQDTGWRRVGSNSMAVVTGGVDRLLVDAEGRVTMPGPFRISGDQLPAIDLLRNGVGQWFMGGTGTAGDNSWSVRFNQVAPYLKLDTVGNLFIGGASGAEHRIRKAVQNNGGTPILHIMGDTELVASFAGVTGGLGSTANAAFRVGADGTTGRSIGALGTINASGADYAEYVRKADGCGAIAKGDVCGIDRDGRLTKTWAEAVSYVVKSTDPNLVGGDSWSGDVEPRPEAPAPLAPQPSEPVAPEPFGEPAPAQAESESEGTFAVRVHEWEQGRDAANAAFESYAAAMDAYPTALAAWMAEERAHVAATADYDAALAEWEASFEAERQKVDRIAFCGVVPVNVSADVVADCEAAIAGGERIYLVATANGGGIAAKAVRKSDMTLADHLDRLGPVWRIEDGRPVIDVQHG